MPNNVIGKSSINSENKTDTSLFVQKPHLRSNNLESNFEEDIDSKNQFRFRKLPDPISIREAASKIYVDNVYKKTFDFNDVKLEIIKLVNVNYQPVIDRALCKNI